jgi:hypothetical protein
MESKSSRANPHVIALGSRRGFLLAGLSSVIFPNAQHSRSAGAILNSPRPFGSIKSSAQRTATFRPGVNAVRQLINRRILTQ